MRILFVIDSLKFGGAERQLVELIKGLRHRNYDIHLVCLIKARESEGYGEVASSLGVNLQYFERGEKYNIFGPIWNLAKYIRANQIEIIHGFMNMGSLFGVLAGKLTRRPVICSAIRDAKDKSRREKHLKKLLSRLCDCVVANSRAGFSNRFNKMKPHFHVIYNGVDFSRFDLYDIDRLEVKKKLGLTGFGRIVGVVARLSNHKDHMTVLKAIPNVLQHFPETCFLIVGDGPERKRLEGLAQGMGIEKNVVFLGFRKDVDKLYQIFDISLLLTNADVVLEGLSNVLIEAMACGVPVVASSGGGTDEIIRNGVTGVLVPPKDPVRVADELIRLLSKEEAKTLAVQGKRAVRHMFDLNRYVKEYEMLYEQLIGK
jgi:glycosyltransferase involved in cell wall biosynthesis